MRAYDAVIAGGGPAGAAAAITLARQGVRVLIADASGSDAPRIGESLPPSAGVLLRELGCEGALEAGLHRQSFGTLSSWGSEELVARDFIFQLHGHGLQLERGTFDSMLRDAALGAGAELKSRARICLNSDDAGLSTPSTGHKLRLHSPSHSEEIRCEWLIDATGRASALARQKGAIRLHSDRLLAIYTLLEPRISGDNHGSTMVEAVAAGWWYTVLLPSGRRLAAFLTDGDLIDGRALCQSTPFWAKLQETHHLSELCSAYDYRPVASPRGADASSSRLNCLTGPRWLAIGDAALSFDPLSSKGIANALYTGILGAKTLLRALNGDGNAVRTFQEHLHLIFHVYCLQQRYFYSTEPRWRNEVFWRRRLDGDPLANRAGAFVLPREDLTRENAKTT